MSARGDEIAPELSVLVPAFNEEKLLAETLSHLARALADAGVPAHGYELIVCDNDSTDATADIARQHGAQVVHEPHRQIARARNAAASAARGRFLLFVDADTQPSSALIAEALSLLRSARVVGGGAVVDGLGLSPPWRLALAVWNALSRVGSFACGAFVFCTREAFRAVGGFDEDLYAAEELVLSRRLQRYARQHGQAFRIITRHRLKTSMRKLELYAPRELLAMTARGLRHPLKAVRDRRFLDAWYDGRR